MLIILLRTIILYFIVLFVVRVMGKAELSKMDPFEMIVLFMMAELAAIPIESLDIPLLNGAASILTLLFLQVSISFLSMKSKRISHFLNGKPSVLINKGKISEKELKSQRITIDDLMKQLRLKNFPSPADVDYLVLESNGDFSVIPKPEKAPLTPGDMKIATSPKVMPMVVISDGMLNKKSLNSMGKDENYIRGELSKANITDYSQVFICFFDENSQLHVFPRSKNKYEMTGEANLK